MRLKRLVRDRYDLSLPGQRLRLRVWCLKLVMERSSGWYLARAWGEVSKKALPTLQSITVMTYMLLASTTVPRGGMVRVVVSVVDRKELPLKVMFAMIPRRDGLFNRQQAPRLSRVINI